VAAKFDTSGLATFRQVKSPSVVAVARDDDKVGIGALRSGQYA
jgi:hypothetical protein